MVDTDTFLTTLYVQPRHTLFQTFHPLSERVGFQLWLFAAHAVPLFWEALRLLVHVYGYLFPVYPLRGDGKEGEKQQRPLCLYVWEGLSARCRWIEFLYTTDGVVGQMLRCTNNGR